jgi:hypothetical protein
MKLAFKLPTEATVKKYGFFFMVALVPTPVTLTPAENDNDK